MEYVPGQSLESFLKSKNSLLVNCVMVKAIDGLRYLADRGVIHGDYHARNVLVFPGPGDCPEIKIIDFGFSRKISAIEQDQVAVDLGLLFKGADASGAAEPGERAKSEMSAVIDAYPVSASLAAEAANKFGNTWLDAIAPSLIPRSDPPTGRFTCKPATEVTSGRSLEEYVCDVNGLWVEYLSHPSIEAVERINRNVNCVMKKIVSHIGDESGLVPSNPEVTVVSWDNDPACPDVVLQSKGKLCPANKPDQVAAAVLTVVRMMDTITAMISNMTSKTSGKYSISAACTPLASLIDDKSVPVTVSPDQGVVEAVAKLLRMYPVTRAFVSKHVTVPHGWVQMLAKAMSLSRVPVTTDIKTPNTPVSTQTREPRRALKALGVALPLVVAALAYRLI
jgi:Protein tyrosine and serine/threonine kinase